LLIFSVFLALGTHGKHSVIMSGDNCFWQCILLHQ